MKKKTAIVKTKEFGLSAIKASVKAMALAKGYTKDKKVIEERIDLLKEQLKREVLGQKVFIKGITEIEEIDNLAINEEITIYLNPYYELAIAKNLKPFPVDLENEENTKWLNNFEYFLALNLLHFKDTGEALKSTMGLDYHPEEIYETLDIIVNYYDIENPQRSIVQNNPNILYYCPKGEKIKELEKDICIYETSYIIKCLGTAKDMNELIIDTGYSKEKVEKYLKDIIESSEYIKAYKERAMEILESNEVIN